MTGEPAGGSALVRRRRSIVIEHAAGNPEPVSRVEGAREGGAPDASARAEQSPTPRSLEHAGRIAEAQSEHPPGSGTGLRLSASVGLVASSADKTPGGAEIARETYGLEELSIVLSHYDVGPIEAILEFRRGSRRSPKLLIKARTGAYLLKRRAPGRDDHERVALSHAVQRHLAQRQFPLPRLIPTRDSGQTALRISGRTYELFEFIPGTKYDASLPATTEAGRTLALFHKLLADHDTSAIPTSGSYHGAKQILDQLDHIAKNAADDRELASVCADLRRAYETSAKQVDAAGIHDWPRQIVHGDWHPGNTLYRGQKVVAVIDFDSARLEARVLDIANGALQFSITMNGPKLDDWPEYLDESRFKRFCRGYDSVEGCILSTAELRVVPWLMVEALIVEAVVPIAATGAFAGLDGGSFLRMVRRKVDWMLKQADSLTELVSA